MLVIVIPRSFGNNECLYEFWSLAPSFHTDTFRGPFFCWHPLKLSGHNVLGKHFIWVLQLWHLAGWQPFELIWKHQLITIKRCLCKDCGRGFKVYHLRLKYSYFYLHIAVFTSAGLGLVKMEKCRKYSPNNVLSV